MGTPDRRTLFARADLADIALRGRVDAESFADPVDMTVSRPLAGMFPSPIDGIPPDTQLLLGEGVRVLDRSDGWSWGQSVLDGYVGYVRTDMLAPPGPTATHQVVTLTAQTYALPELKRPATGILPFGARVAVLEQTDSHARIGADRWIALPQIAPLDSARDWVEIAERFPGVPYVWGGRGGWGLDCSGLVQLARQAAGHICPRDSDMQEAGLGETLDPDAPLLRGDLIFWRGHVGIMRDGETLLHANAHHMAVTSEPLAEAAVRIEGADGGLPTRRARLVAG